MSELPEKTIATINFLTKSFRSKQRVTVYNLFRIGSTQNVPIFRPSNQDSFIKRPNMTIIVIFYRTYQTLTFPTGISQNELLTVRKTDMATQLHVSKTFSFQRYHKASFPLIAKANSQARSECFQILSLDESSRSELASWVLR